MDTVNATEKAHPYPKLKAYFDRKHIGHRIEMAQHLGTRPNYFYRQFNGERPFTEREAIEIEKFTHGEVRCEDILPGLDWNYLRGTAKATAA